MITLRKNAPPGVALHEGDLTRILAASVPFAKLRTDTQRTYALRFARYLDSLGYLHRSGNAWSLAEQEPDSPFFLNWSPRRGEFVGDAPPERVCAAMRYLGSGPKARTELETQGFRNASTCLISLGLASANEGTISALRANDDVESQVATAVKTRSSFKAARSALSTEPNMEAIQLGRQISQSLGVSWREASCLRRGNAMRRWVVWVTNLEHNVTPSVAEHGRTREDVTQ
jgi:hypothetical protein